MKIFLLVMSLFALSPLSANQLYAIPENSSFDKEVLDSYHDDIWNDSSLQENDPMHRTKRASSFRLCTSRLLIPGTLLAMSALPVVDAGPGIGGLVSIAGTIMTAGSVVAVGVMTGGNLGAMAVVGKTGLEATAAAAAVATMAPTP